MNGVRSATNEPARMDFELILKKATLRAGSPSPGRDGSPYVTRLLGHVNDLIRRYLEIEPTPNDLIDVCEKYLAAFPRASCEKYALGKFYDIYAEAVLTEIRTVTKYAECYGCEFVDSCGFVGHPSQKHHPCIILSERPQLWKCYYKAHASVITRVLAAFSEFLVDRPDIYLSFAVPTI